MGKIYKRKNVWYSNFMHNGVQIRKSFGNDKKAREILQREMIVDYNRGKYDTLPEDDSPKDIAIVDLFDAYITDITNEVRKSTVDRYSNVIVNFKIFLTYAHPKIKKVAQLNSKIIKEYKRFRLTTDPKTIELPKNSKLKISHNQMKAQPRTINYELKTLKAIFGWGVKEDYYKDDPAKDIKVKKPTKIRSFNFLTKEQCKLLLENSGGFRSIFFTFINTGMRLGELISLKWSDIDLDRKALKIQVKPGWEPKSGFRDISLNEGMIKCLKEIEPENMSLAERKKRYVFTYPETTRYTKKGEELRGRYLRTQLKKVLIKADLYDPDNPIRTHDLRHTFASNLVMSGVDLATVQKLLGHTDIQITMIYAHLNAEHLEQAVNKLDIDFK